MTKILIELDETEDHILEMVKAKYKIKTKAATVPFILQYFYEELLDLEYRPEFLEKLRKMGERTDDDYVEFDSVDELFDGIREENRKEVEEEVKKTRENKRKTVSHIGAKNKRRRSHRTNPLQKSQVSTKRL